MSLNRTLAGLITTTGDVKSASLDNAASLTVYSTKEDLPTSGMSTGDQAYVTGNSRFYISNGSGWYNVALINATPALTISPSGTIELDTENLTSTTITLTATDSDNAVAGLTYSVESDGNFAGLGTISQDSSVFTITPLSEDSATTTSATLTFKASDGISFGTGSSVISLVFSVQYSSYTSFLLKGRAYGDDNQIDSGSLGMTITENGNIASVALSPYHPGGYSTVFDGTGDYLLTGTTSDALGTNDFTMECWVYPTAAVDAVVFDARSGSASNRPTIAIVSSQLMYQTNGTSRIQAGSVPTNTWSHLAIVRNSNVIYAYVNGTQVGTYSDTSDYGTATRYMLGADDDGSPNAYFVGFVRDARVVVGTAVYTSNFTVPNKPLTAIANTSLLTCHLPYIADGSTNDLSFTFVGDTSTRRFGPYDHKSYLRENHGGSVYIENGNTNYLSLGSNNLRTLGNSDWTLEGWIYPMSSSQQKWMSCRQSSDGYEFFIYWDGKWGFEGFGSNNTSGQQNDAVVYPIRQWYHLAYVNSTTDTKIYINGKLSHTYNNSFTWGASVDNNFGRAINTQEDAGPGYVTDLRFTRSQVYTSDFTPPTAPLTAIANTELLTMRNRNNIMDVSSGFRMTGTAGLQAAVTKFNTDTSKYALYMNGSTYVDVPPSNNAMYPLDLHANDFTIETWVYPTANSNNYPSFITSVSGWSSGAYGHRFDNTGQGGKFSFHLNGVGDPFLSSSSTYSHDQWYHYALTREGNTWKMWINGTLQASGTSSASYNLNYGGMRFGWAAWDGANGYFTGYIQDTRITKGLARYTSAFTPPTAEFDA